MSGEQNKCAKCGQDVSGNTRICSGCEKILAAKLAEAEIKNSELDGDKPFDKVRL